MKKLGVIIGRFQTAKLHAGHFALINEVLSKCDNLLIFIGSSRTRFTRRNPLDYPTRKAMFEARFPSNHYTNINYDNTIDFKSDNVWSDQVDRLIAKEIERLGGDYEPTLYGCRDSFIPYYKNNIPTVALLDIEVANVSATAERKAIGEVPRDTEDFRAGIIYASQNRFPNVHPTVDVAIFNEDYSEILLGRKHAETLFRFIGGFTDPTDMTLENAGRREAMEETGVEVDAFEYICSVRVHDWRYVAEDDKIMTTLFAAKYIFGAPKGADDIAEVKWVKVADLKEEDLVTEHGKLLETLKLWHEAKLLKEYIKNNISVESAD